MPASSSAGRPPRSALLPFGGAGGLFGCPLADALGMSTIVIPPHPGALSALGLATAVERADLLTSFHRAVEELEQDAIDAALTPLLREGAAQVPGAVLARYADCRFRGQGYEVTVPIEETDPRRIREACLAAHRQRYAHTGGDQGEGEGGEIVSLRVVALREGPLPRFTRAARPAHGAAALRAIV